MDFLFLEWLGLNWLGKPAWMWLAFLGLVVVLLAFDLGVLGRRAAQMNIRQSLWLSAGYIGVALLYGTWVWFTLGAPSGLAFFTGFAVEKTLALDNVFVISLIFTYFAIPVAYQRRVLLWGILGVIVLRGIMIGVGTALVSNFDWVLWVFGAFLLFTGVRMLVQKEGETEIGHNPLLKFLRRLPLTDKLHGEQFFVRQPNPAGRLQLYATPLFLTLILVEAADVIFAVDSIPAIFAITQDPFIVYTSNIFAILGLRALYFALAAMVHRFAYLKPALALVLVFIGAKIFYNQLFGKLDPAISLGVTLALLAGGIIVSLIKSRGQEPETPPAA